MTSDLVLLVLLYDKNEVLISNASFLKELFNLNILNSTPSRITKSIEATNIKQMDAV
jgi:hypothetical protein